VQASGEQRVVLDMQPSKLTSGTRAPSVVVDKLVTAWVRMLVTGACGLPVVGVVVGRDARVSLQPLAQAEAETHLATLLQTWAQGMTEPLPLPCKTGLAWVAGAPDVQTVYEGGPQRSGEVQDACLARQYPDFEALTADTRFADLAQMVLAPLQAWAKSHSTVELHDPEAFDE